MLADKAYDSNALRQIIASIGAEAVIPSNRSRKIIIPHDELAYTHRNRIEGCFNQNEALPPLRHQIRPQSHSLPRLRLSRCHYALAAVNVDRP